MYKPSKDILNKLEQLYSKDYNAIMLLLKSYLDRYDQLHSNRIIRCVIYLSQSNIEDFKRYIEAAVQDPRDVIFWAEYEDHNTSYPKRVRDLTNVFE